MSLHETLKEGRKSTQMSQHELALKAGVSRPTVARVERGDDISLSNLCQIAEVLGYELKLSKLAK